MSLNSLASSRVAREIATRPGAAGFRATSDDTIAPRDVQNAVSALVEYIPAETITLYIAAIAVVPLWIDTAPRINAGSSTRSSRRLLRLFSRRYMPASEGLRAKFLGRGLRNGHGG